MRHLKYFESVRNLSKVRRWPTKTYGKGNKERTCSAFSR